MRTPFFKDNFTAEEIPQVIQLGERLFAVKFSLMKMIPARFIFDRAEAEGKLRAGTSVLETSSGTFALALARLCAQRSYPLVIVSDPEIESLRLRLENLGARIEVVRSTGKDGGIQAARLNRLRELQAERPDHFFPNQYGNTNNPASYAPVAELVAETVGRVGSLVGPIGSGGSMCGTSRYLRTLLPEMRAVGVDTFGSVLFGTKEEPRALRGLGSSIMPPNVDHSVFDQVHWVAADLAFRATRELYREHDLYAGPTSGAAYLVARALAERGKERVAFLCPDTGDRYRDTVYSEGWLREHGLLAETTPDAPLEVRDPRDAGPPWSAFEWRRRDYAGVMGAPFVPSTPGAPAPTR